MDVCCSIKEKIVLAVGIGTQMEASEKTPQIMADTGKSHNRVKRGLDVFWNQRLSLGASFCSA